jgi:hypothetical protein
MAGGAEMSESVSIEEIEKLYECLKNQLAEIKILLTKLS